MASKWKKYDKQIQKLVKKLDTPLLVAKAILNTTELTRDADLLRVYITRGVHGGKFVDANFTTGGANYGPKKLKRKRLYYDIETSPNVVYSWRAGNKVRISHDNILEERKVICICWKWEGEGKVYHRTWGLLQDDKEMLKEFIAVMNEADEIVAHNGDRFDERWLRGRALYHRLPMKYKYRSIDTYKKAKSVFNLNSYKLDYIADFLGYGNKIDVQFGLWKDIMLGDQEALKKMVDYCEHDVRLLELVHDDIKNYTIHNTHYGVLKGEKGYKSDCPECRSKDINSNRSYTTASGTIKRNMQCNNCGKHYVISNKAFMTWRADKSLGTIKG
jgi:hypothetical protein